MKTSRTQQPVMVFDPGAELDWLLEGLPRMRVRTWRDSQHELEPDATHYLYVSQGAAQLRRNDLRFPLEQGMYAATVGGTIGGSGQGLIISHLGFEGMFQIGGPIEARGRLRYIDGCTDSLLIAPCLLGDPCLNHLHIPKGTRQTRHTHPSVRVGMIARGSGVCVTPDRELPLTAGVSFVLAKDVPHSFHTTDQALDVVVYHPDSDVGPTHESHPMINRTIIAP